MFFMEFLEQRVSLEEVRVSDVPLIFLLVMVTSLLRKGKTNSATKWIQINNFFLYLSLTQLAEF